MSSAPAPIASDGAHHGRASSTAQTANGGKSAAHATPGHAGHAHQGSVALTVKSAAKSSTLDGAIKVVDDEDMFSHDLISPVLLTFDSKTNPNLEADFLISYTAKYLNGMRAALVISAVIWFAFLGNDIRQQQRGLRQHFTATVILRIAGVLVASLACYSSYTRRHRQHIQAIVCGTLIFLAVSQIVFGILQEDTLDPTYSVPMLLLFSTSATFFRLRFLLSLVCNVTMLVLFAVLTTATGAYHSNTNLLITLIFLAAGSVIFTAHAYNRELIIRRAHLNAGKLAHEEQRAHNMLAKMLPEQIITELKKGSNFIYKYHKEVSVLFSHICEFDAHAAHLSSRELVNLLNSMFSEFDKLTYNHQVYKVETIGDVYLVSASVPDYRPDHADALCMLAMDMRASMHKFQIPEQEPIELRVGINTGSIIAGVVGLKYPRFRLMGDTVNVASRMSTTCGPKDIQLSESAFKALTSEGLVIKKRGEIFVKGKGNMPTYLLQYKLPHGAPRPDLSTDPTLIITVAREAQLASVSGGIVSPQMAAVRDASGRPTTAGRGSTPPPPEAKRPAPAPPAEGDDPDLEARIREKAALVQVQAEIVPAAAGAGSPTGALVGPTAAAGASAAIASPTSAAPGSVAVMSMSSSASSATSTEEKKADSQTSPTDAALMSTRPGHVSNPSITDNQAVITAKREKGYKLLEVPRLRDILYKEEWKKFISLKFARHHELEREFQEGYFLKFAAPNRTVLAQTLVVLLILSIYDTIVPNTNTPAPGHDLVVDSWIFRGAVLALGLAVYVFEWSSYYLQHGQPWMQLLNSLLVVAFGVTIIQIDTWMEDVTQVYGVACVLLLLAAISMFFFLQFHYVLVASALILVFYVIAGSVENDSFPLIVFFLVAAATLYVRSAYSSEFYLRRDFVRMLKQRNEERITREFLDGMLPVNVLRELQDIERKGMVGKEFIVHETPNVSVFFCDVVGFTTIAGQLLPEDVVAVLNVLFSAFDNLTTKHSVYKVETIGDAYMACSGLVTKQEHHSRDLVTCALEMQKATTTMRATVKDGKRVPIRVRIGIHTGFVIAGVVGIKMPRYHLFGETVTTAEEVENKGVPDGVVVSKTTFDLLGGMFEAEERPPIPLSGQDEPLRNWHIKGHKQQPTAAVPVVDVPIGRDPKDEKELRAAKRSSQGGKLKPMTVTLNQLPGTPMN